MGGGVVGGSLFFVKVMALTHYSSVIENLIWDFWLGGFGEGRESKGRKEGKKIELWDLLN